MNAIPPVTRWLLIINVLAFGLQQLLGEALTVHFALWPLGGPAELETSQGIVTVQFQLWQLLTYGFLHGSVMHLAFNMLALYMFGGPLEQLWGSRPFTTYYLACVIAAALAQLAIVGYSAAGADFAPTIGASGGVFGLLLGFGMMYPQARIVLLFPPIPMPAWLFVILYGTLELYLGFSNRQPGVAHFAHLGGMAAGIVLIQYWRGRLPLKPKRILMR